MAAGGAVDGRALEDDVAAILEPNTEMTGRCLVVGKIEPKCRAGGVDSERMRVIALESGEFKGEDHTVGAPAFCAEAIIAGRDADGTGTGTEGVEDVRTQVHMTDIEPEDLFVIGQFGGQFIGAAVGGDAFSGALVS